MLGDTTTAMAGALATFGERQALVHVEAATHRKFWNASDTDELVMLVVGGKDGYVERDGRLVDMDRDLPRRQAFGG